MSTRVHRVPMKKCRVCKKRKETYRFHKNRRAKDGLRGDCAACNAKSRAARRLLGPDTVSNEPRDGIYWVRIPVERLRPLAETYLKEHPDVNGFGRKGESLPRQLYRVLHEPEPFVGWDFAERFLIKLGLEHMWHIRPEQGGLSDLYDLNVCVASSIGAETPRRENAHLQQVGGEGSVSSSPEAALASPPLSRGRTSTTERKAA